MPGAIRKKPPRMKTGTNGTVCMGMAQPPKASIDPVVVASPASMSMYSA